MSDTVRCLAVALIIAGFSGLNHSTAQDLSISLGRVNRSVTSAEHKLYPEIQLAVRVASLSDGRHPLRAALYWGFWLDSFAASYEGGGIRYEGGGIRYGEGGIRSTHLLGLRVNFAPTAARLRPQLVVGYTSLFGPVAEANYVSMIETGISLSLELRSRVRTVVGVSRYQPLVSEDYPWALGQYALRIGLQFELIRPNRGQSGQQIRQGP